MTRVITIASGKGGVGKTWFAITLAQALACGGRRTLLFDAALSLANVDIQLGLGEGADLAGVLGGRYRLAAAARHVETAGFDVIPGRSGSGALAGIAPSEVHLLAGELRMLAAGYDVVLVDLPAGIDHPILRALDFASDRLILTVDGPTALTDAYVALKVGCRTRPGPLPALVVNQASDHAAGRSVHKGFARITARFLGLLPPLAGVVRRDRGVQAAIRSQTPLLSHDPQSPAARDVIALARDLWTGQR
jgi:flagellar biosynthesis protein FlhG